jgi:hypothetical protein
LISVRGGRALKFSDASKLADGRSVATRVTSPPAGRSPSNGLFETAHAEARSGLVNRFSTTRSVRVLAATLCMLGAAAAQVTPESGNVGGVNGPFDVFFVNGSNGGADRMLEIGLNKPVNLQLLPAGSVGAGAPFALFGSFGVPGPGDVTALPFGLGSMAFVPCPLQPLNPLLFTLTDQFGLGCPQLIPSSTTPWNFNFAGFPFPFTAAVQGVIFDPAGVLGISVTNLVTTKVVDDRLEVLYSRIAGHPTAVVPGAVDTSGNPAVTEFRAFEQLVGSPDGTQWMLRGRTQQGTASETMMMLGAGATGTVFAQKGRPVHGGLPGEVYDFFGSGLGRFNNANDFAFSARAVGGLAANGHKVIRVVGGAGTVVQQQGGALIGLVDIATNPTGDEIYGNSVGSAHLLDNLAVGLQDSTIGMISTTRRPAIFYDNVAFHQANVTQVVGLDGVTPQTWATIDANAFYTTPDGAHWNATGRIVAPTTMDAVLVVDGSVVIQEGVTIPTTSLVASSILNVALAGNGHWFARGAHTGGVYAVVDGLLAAKTGDPITPGSTEHWTTTYSAFVGNRLGEWALFGTTDSGSTATDNVVVFNGTTVVAREGDPVDLNRNGVFDDDVFLGRGNDTLTPFSADNAFLGDDGFLYFFVNLRNGAGVDLANLPSFGVPLALLRVKIPRG